MLQKNHNPNLGFLTLLRRVGWHAPFIIVNIIKPFKKTKMRLMIIINIDLRTTYNAQACRFRGCSIHLNRSGPPLCEESNQNSISNSPETNLLLVISIACAGWTNTGEPSHPQAISDVQVRLIICYSLGQCKED